MIKLCLVSPRPITMHTIVRTNDLIKGILGIVKALPLFNMMVPFF